MKRRGEQKVPSGDSGRTWFPEMIAILQEEWKASMSFEELILLRDRLNSLLQQIREDRKIKSPMFWCKNCKEYHRSASPQVSVRAMILALGRFKIAEEIEVKILEKNWRKHSKEKELDPYGRPKIKED